MDWLTSYVRDNEDVQFKSLTNDQTILVLAGPRARDVLSKAARGDWSKDAFPWLSVRECFIGFAPATVMAVSFSGELAYEIHVPNSALYAAYLALTDAGVEHELGLFGTRAVESMRMEKGFLHWKSDLITEFDPFETGWIDLSKWINPISLVKPRWKTAFAMAFRNAWCRWKSTAIMRLPMAVHRLCRGRCRWYDHLWGMGVSRW